MKGTRLHAALETQEKKNARIFARSSARAIVLVVIDDVRTVLTISSPVHVL